MSSHRCLLESCNRLLLLLLMLSAVWVSDSSASLKPERFNTQRSPLKCAFIPAQLPSALLMSSVTLSGSFWCWCESSTFIHLAHFFSRWACVHGGVTSPGFASSVSARSGLSAFPVMKVRRGIWERCCLQGLMVDSHWIPPSQFWKWRFSKERSSDQEPFLAPYGSWVAIWLFGD